MIVLVIAVLAFFMLIAISLPVHAKEASVQQSPSTLEEAVIRCAQESHAFYARRPLSGKLLARQLLRRLNALSSRANRHTLPDTAQSQLLLENLRLLQTSAHTLKEAACPMLPVTHEQIRVDLFALTMLQANDFHLTESALFRALRAYDETRALSLDELSHLKIAFLRTLLRQLSPLLAQALCEKNASVFDPTRLSQIIDALRGLDSIDFSRVTQACSSVCAMLELDPAGIYEQLDEESRLLYRTHVQRIAHDVSLSETSVVQAALLLSRESTHAPSNHVGYYLLSDGIRALYNRLGGMPFFTRARLWMGMHPAVFLIAAQVLLGATVCLLFSLLGTPWLFLPLCTLSASPAIHALIARFVRRHFPPRPLPTLALDRIPDTARTLVVIPALLSSRESAAQLIDHLAVLERAGNDANLDYLLLGDYRDSEAAQEVDDADIIACIRDGIARLNQAHPAKFFYLHRKRVYDPAHRRHMGLMRKRGALLCVCDLIENGCTDAAIAEITFDPATFHHHYTYMLVLDRDTLLPPGCAQKLIGAMLHPLCSASILSPRMESAARLIGTNLADMLGGPGGVPLYQGGVGEMYQTLCGHGSFSGKGLIRVHDFACKTQPVTARYALSHDLLEGELCQSALMENAALYDGPPLRLTPFFLQLERWTRGDWQLLPWLFPRVPMQENQRVKNPLSLLSRLKIFDNLRRSLVAPSQLALLFLLAMIGSASGCLLTLVLAHLDALISLNPRAPKHAYMRLALLPRFAYVSIRAAARALYRQFISGAHLLEWMTAHDAHNAPDPSKGDALQGWCAAALLLLSVPELYALSITVWLAIAFLFTPQLSRYLNAPIHETRPLDESERSDLLRWARATWTFFESNVTPESRFLPPDNLQIDPPRGAALRTSPTNIGLYLLSCAGAQSIGLIEPDELLTRLSNTLDTLKALPTWRGHLYNWYDVRTGAPLAYDVSSVDSGNLLACLIVCIQTLRSLSALGPDGFLLADAYESLLRDTDIAALYDKECDLFFVGAAIEDNSPAFTDAHYDQLASESRLLSYVACARHAVPHRHWQRLTRRMACTPFGDALLSWSGTMFEYLMPRLLQRGVSDTLLTKACQTAVLAQMNLPGISPWGVSESGRYVFDTEQNYQYHAFGVPQLSLRSDRFIHVITPYAGALALSVFPHAAIQNLRHMESVGLFDEAMGFYEAADYTVSDRVRIVKSHMAHHQGMLFCAIVNALTGNALVTLFHRDPAMEAFSLFLEERMT